jgi:hypothetical protein
MTTITWKLYSKWTLNENFLCTGYAKKEENEETAVAVAKKENVLKFILQR